LRDYLLLGKRESGPWGIRVVHRESRAVGMDTLEAGVPSMVRILPVGSIPVVVAPDKRQAEDILDTRDIHREEVVGVHKD